MVAHDKKSLPVKFSTDARTIRKRFLLLNRERLKLARTTLRNKKRIFVDVLPLLFHINHPALPGFISKDTPAGIADFSPNQQSINDAMKISDEFYYERRAMHIYNIQALYMIGSSGTIAYTEKSDFDIWVCYRKELDEKQIRLLNEKCELIRLWAESLHLEVSFFVLNDQKFKSGAMQELSNESSGSAQFHILLEEFYRTALLLAGKYPAWWLVPPNRKIDYDNYLQQLHNNREILNYEYLDFGNLVQIPANEFFGAALWQLNKAIGSPHKSLLKLLLIESYASEYPKMELLCTRYKSEIYKGEVKLSNLDPYVMMNKKVEEYLLGINEPKRCELARRCFYFKIGKKLSTPSPRRINRQYELMLQLVNEWGWDLKHLAYLDSHHSWKIKQVDAEKTTLVKELTRSYRMLSDFARTTTKESYINKEDLNLLGRRLYAAFERKIGKLELINPDVSSDLSELRVAFVIHKTEQTTVWLLYNQDFDEAKENKIAPIKRAESMIELVAWAHFNKILGHNSLITLHNTNSILDSGELLAIIDTFREVYPKHKVLTPTIDQMKESSHLEEATLFINVGADPLASHTKRGIHLTSNRSDALSYGGFWKNLANVFDLMTINNWGEVINTRYYGVNAVMDCLIGLLQWSPLDSEYRPPNIQTFSFCSNRANSIAERIQQFFNDIIKVFYDTTAGEYIRYIVNVGPAYFILQSENAQIQYKRLKNETELFRELGLPQFSYRHILFDRYTFKKHPFPVIVKYNEPNKVQLFYEILNDNATIWILDEKGSIFKQEVALHSKESLLNHYHKFLSTAVLRCNSIMHSANLDNAINPNIEYFQVSKNKTGKYKVHQTTPKFQTTMNDCFSLQMIGDISGTNNSHYTIYCDGIEFSSLEYGENVIDEVAAHILRHRQNGERYPIYITDLEVSRNLFSGNNAPSVQIIHYLNYKNIIETKLNRALDKI